MSVLGVTTATQSKWIAWLRRVGACGEAIAWCKTQPSKAAAWRSCERGDWMLWVISKTVGTPGDASRKPLIMAACECARLALPYICAGEKRPLRSIEAVEAWCREEVTLDTVRSAAADAYAAATPASSAAAYFAAAATAAYATAYANAFDVDAVDFAATYVVSAAAYASDASEQATLQRCADIARKHFPKPPRIPSAARRAGR